VIGLAFSFAAGAQQVPFATGEWDPYTGTALPNQGIASEIVAAACKAGGIDYRFDFLPWNRAEKSVLEGQAFCAFPYSKNDERMAKFDYSDTLIYTATNFVYYAKNKKIAGLKIASWADVKPFKVAYITGAWLEKDMKAAGIDVTPVPDNDTGIKMLKAGRVDFVIDDSAVLVAAVKKLFPSEADSFMYIDSDMFGSKTAGAVYLMVSRTYPNSKALLEKFNKGFAIIKSSGVLDGLAKKYGVTVK
jgi:polar amino acid transport system substrate-binding protein